MSGLPHVAGSCMELVWLKQAQGTRAAGRKWLLWPPGLQKGKEGTMGSKVTVRNARLNWSIGKESLRQEQLCGASLWVRVCDWGAGPTAGRVKQEHSPGTQPKDELASLGMSKARAAGHPRPTEASVSLWAPLSLPIRMWQRSNSVLYVESNCHYYNC